MDRHSHRHSVLKDAVTQQIKAGLEAKAFSAVLHHPSSEKILLQVFSPSSTASKLFPF